TSLILPEGLTNLTTLNLSANQLTNLILPQGLTRLSTLRLDGNPLTRLTLPDGLTNLTVLDISFDQLRSLTLPPGLTSLTTLTFDDDPLQTLVVPEPLAVTSLAAMVASFKRRGGSVYTYPLTVSLISPKPTLAAGFSFTLTGPPAAYTIVSSSNLVAWNELGTITHALG